MPRTSSASAIRPAASAARFLGGAREPLRREDRDAVARVDPRRVHLLEDARDAPPLAVADHIHVELDAGHELVDAQRPPDIGPEVVDDVRLGPEDRDPPSADHP